MSAAGNAQRYWAFISYSHADEAIAAQLHRELERYVLPRRVRGAHGLPARLTPIFRDVEELEAASGLNTRLQDALDDSRWLIVLCSPNSAKSKYVNAEIEYFLGEHGPERILCVLLEGEPPECFPPALRKLPDEPLAADLRAGRDEQLARIKLIAALAGVGFTELRNREALRKRQQKLLTAAGLAIANIGGLAYWDLFQREDASYYNGYVRRHGIWEGVDRLTPEQASHRWFAYRFTRYGRLHPPARVDYVNGSGHCAADGMSTLLKKDSIDYIAPTTRYCSATFNYTPEGRIQQENLLNELGVPKESLTYTTPDLAQFTREGFDSPSGGGIRYVQFQRAEDGTESEIRFLYSRGVPRANRNSEYGFRQRFDEAGHLLERAVLDAEGQPSVEIQQYRYDDDGRLLEQRIVDENGQPTTGREGWASLRWQYDDWGNFIREEYFGADGEPMINAEYYATRVREYDARGNVTRECHEDAQGQVVMAKDSYPCARSVYDPNGRLLEQYAEWADGKQVPVNGTASGFIFRYDELGNVIEFTFRDPEGKPAESAYGSAIERYTHDERGYLTVQHFLDAQGRPVLSPYGATIRTRFDERGNILEFRFEDIEGKLFLRPERGVAIYRFIYDERGNMKSVEAFGTDEKPTTELRGWSRTEHEVDQFGNRVATHYYGNQGQRTRHVDGMAVVRRRFDRLGRQIEETYQDEQQQPVLHKGGYYGYRVEYDARGRETQRLYLDASGAVARMPELGYAGVRNVYSAQGVLIGEQFLDPDGEPARDAPVQRLEYQRNAIGDELERRYYDSRGQLAPARDSGCTIIRHDLDQYMRKTAEHCLGPQGQPVNRREAGWAVKRRILENGRLIREEFFDAAGKLVMPKT